MPTPFTHLASAQTLLQDPLVPAQMRAFLHEHLPAFLLGNIAADARISGNVAREHTHFFSYERPIEQHPWRVMFTQHPTLAPAHSPSQRAFLAGYTAHLSLDEIWSIDMVRPHFGLGDWGTRYHRFLMLHIILIYMDERDYHALEDWQQPTLCAALPQQWTPFLNDDTLTEWRDFIGRQVPHGASETLAVLGERVQKTPAELRVILDSPAQMQSDLWQYVPQDVLAQVEANMYAHARSQMIAYLNDE
jgi:hypothetical protein